jgi:hypothetical protein
MPRERATDARLLAGKCECGAVRFAVPDEFLYAANCHCSNCRAATGSAFKPFAGVEREKLRVTDGAETPMIVGERDENHTRCAACGSLLFSSSAAAPTSTSRSARSSTSPIRPTEHIFVGSKAPWFEITDGLPQAEEYE